MQHQWWRLKKSNFGGSTLLELGVKGPLYTVIMWCRSGDDRFVMFFWTPNWFYVEVGPCSIMSLYIGVLYSVVNPSLYFFKSKLILVVHLFSSFVQGLTFWEWIGSDALELSWSHDRWPKLDMCSNHDRSSALELSQILSTLAL